MPKVHLGRTAGARRGVTYLGVSQRSTSEGQERLQKRARRQKQAIVRDARLLASSEDWRATSERFAVLRRRWKAAGSAGREYDEKLWKIFEAAAEEFHKRRRRHFDEAARIAKARAEDRRRRRDEYVQRVEQRIAGHHEMIGKLRAQRRELALRRRGLMPGWVGEEIAEELDSRVEEIDGYIEERQRWLDEDTERVARAMVGQDEVSVTEFYQRLTSTDA
jgi:nitroreductase